MSFTIVVNDNREARLNPIWERDKQRRLDSLNAALANASSQEAIDQLNAAIESVNNEEVQTYVLQKAKLGIQITERAIKEKELRAEASLLVKEGLDAVDSEINDI